MNVGYLNHFLSEEQYFVQKIKCFLRDFVCVADFTSQTSAVHWVIGDNSLKKLVLWPIHSMINTSVSQKNPEKNVSWLPRLLIIIRDDSDLICILEWFLKDRVTLKTEVAAENTDLTVINCILKYNEVENNCFIFLSRPKSYKIFLVLL